MPIRTAHQLLKTKGSIPAITVLIMHRVPASQIQYSSRTKKDLKQKKRAERLEILPTRQNFVITFAEIGLADRHVSHSCHDSHIFGWTFRTGAIHEKYIDDRLKVPVRLLLGHYPDFPTYTLHKPDSSVQPRPRNRRCAKKRN